MILKISRCKSRSGLLPTLLSRSLYWWYLLKNRLTENSRNKRRIRVNQLSTDSTSNILEKSSLLRLLLLGLFSSSSLLLLLFSSLPLLLLLSSCRSAGTAVVMFLNDWVWIILVAKLARGIRATTHMSS